MGQQVGDKVGGWTDGRTDGWIDGWTERKVVSQSQYISQVFILSINKTEFWLH
jgi:hypothetical protein